MKLTKKHLMYGSIVLVVLLLLFIKGCASKSSAQNLPNVDWKSSDVKSITNFAVFDSNRSVKIRFSLLNSFNKYVSVDGTADVEILDAYGDLLFFKSFPVKKKDFKIYTFILTGQKFLAYSFDIPKSEINKSASQNGTVYLIFHANGKSFKSSSPIRNLKTYTNAEIIKINNQRFLSSSVQVDQKMNKCGFEVDVLRMGFFKPFGSENTYFRVDMSVKNTGTSLSDFSPSDIVLVDDSGGSHELVDSYGFDTASKLAPSQTTSGYLLFKNVPPTTQSVVFSFDVDNAEGNPCTFSFHIPLIK